MGGQNDKAEVLEILIYAVRQAKDWNFVAPNKVDSINTVIVSKYPFQRCCKYRELILTTKYFFNFYEPKTSPIV